jgi:phosphohistidine swiveling domain-containing protein
MPEGPELDEKIRAHVAEFAWFGTHHWEGEGYTEEKCRADIAAARGKEVHVELVATADEGDDSTVWKLLASFAYWRTHCAEATAKVVFASRPRLEKIASAWGLDYKGLTYLTATEIVGGLEKGDAFSLPENYEERKKGYGIIVGDEEYIFTGAELAHAIELGVPKVEVSGTEAKGTVASKGGLVTGTARIMLGPSDFGRFNEGDILIANETTPDFVPLMKKAAAIVTDTGGITSHAAIVSRELKKPCVIGTKISTKIFKDGETIEVDAVKGIVRLVDKAS